jgi:hypothetical protein
MRKTILKFAAIAAAAMFSTASWAVTFGDGGAALTTVLNDIAVDGDLGVDVVNDQLADTEDSYWSIGATGGSVATVIIELAGLAGTNEFGLYDKSNPANTVTLFGGTAVTGSQAVVTILLDGSVLVNFVDQNVDFAANAFGYFLNNPTSGFGGSATYYSDTSLNADDFDHMAAYQGNGELVQIGQIAPGTWLSTEYILAWEDIFGGGDADFDDFVVMVESIDPIPEPSILALLGLGMLGLGLSRRKRN